MSSDDLTRGPIRRHLIRLAIPATMGMLFNTFYNLADLWFAGRLSDDALSGMSIASSVFFLMLSVGIGMQIGTSAVMAPLVGQKKLLEAATTADNAVGLGIVFSILVLLPGLIAAPSLVVFLGAELHVSPYAMEYLKVTLSGSSGFVLSFVAAGALMAFGDTRSNSLAIALGFVANLVLNALFVFVFDLGVMGLAIATVIVKFATAAYLFYVLAKRLGRYNKPRADGKHWLALLRQVLPASMNMLTIILGSFITVALIGRFGSQHVAGFSIGLRLEQVLLLPALGLNSAVMAIAGQNFGVGNFHRISQTYREGLLIGLVMAAVSIPIMVYLSPGMVGWFTANDEIIATGASYLRIDAIAFYAYVILFLSVATLQAIKQPLFPMLLGIARHLVVPAAINYLLIVVWGYPLIWLFYTIVAVVVVSAVIAFWYTTRQIVRGQLLSP